MPYKAPRTQEEEMALAAAEKRQPVCMVCGHIINKIQEMQHDNIEWTWNEERKQFEKGEDDGESEGAYHACNECDDGCEAQPDGLSDNELVRY
nr:hypothetical protein [uncultured Nitrososphaera sp.]